MQGEYKVSRTTDGHSTSRLKEIWCQQWTNFDRLTATANRWTEISNCKGNTVTYEVSMQHPVGMNVVNAVEYLIQKWLHHALWDIHHFLVCLCRPVVLYYMLPIQHHKMQQPIANNVPVYSKAMKQLFSRQCHAIMLPITLVAQMGVRVYLHIVCQTKRPII